MKHRVAKVRQVLLFLLLGAILNVAVAWGCALWQPLNVAMYLSRNAGGVFERQDGYQRWLVHSVGRRGAQRISSQWVDPDIRGIFSGFWPEARPEPLIPKWASFACPPQAPGTVGLWHYRWLDARGWPMLAMWSGVSADVESGVASGSVDIYAGIAIDRPTLVSMQATKQQRFLPLYPIWPGLAINTIFYAAILWLLFTLPGVPFALRRRRRIRRGLCPKCAYDLRGGNHAACPECGKAVTQR